MLLWHTLVVPAALMQQICPLVHPFVALKQGLIASPPEEDEPPEEEDDVDEPPDDVDEPPSIVEIPPSLLVDELLLLQPEANPRPILPAPSAAMKRIFAFMETFLPSGKSAGMVARYRSKMKHTWAGSGASCTRYRGATFF